MPRQLIIECLVDLPTDPFEQGEVLAKVKDPWRAFAIVLEDVGGKPKLDIIETRAKLVGSGIKRGRKPKATLRVFEPQDPPSAA